MSTESVTEKKLIPQRITTIPAYTGNVQNFFGLESEIATLFTTCFRNNIINIASEEVSCEEHQKKNFTLSNHMKNQEIFAKLELSSYQSVDQYLASIMSRIKLWKNGGNHGLNTESHLHNIEYVDVGDRKVVVFCSLTLQDQWYFFCDDLDVNALGGFSEGYQVSSSAIS